MFSPKAPEYNALSLNDFSDDDDSVLSDPESGGATTRNGRPKPLASNGGNASTNSNSNSSTNRQQLQMLQQQQDTGLELLGQHAERLGQMSLQISEELDSQNKILTEMDDDLDEANQNLDLVTRKTKEFIEASGGSRNFVLIVTLTCISIVLFLLFLYT